MSDAAVGRPKAAIPSEQADWAQFNPLQAQAKQGPRTVNTVTIFCMAKKIMAEEWRRARGIRKRDPRVAELEKAAREYWDRKRAREEEERRQAAQLEEEHRKILGCVDAFVGAVLEAKQREGIASLEDVEEVIGAAFADLGEVLDVTWAEDGGCSIWLEPWPERRERRARGDARLALRRLSLDAKLKVWAYERVTDPSVLQGKQTDILLRPLRLSLSACGHAQAGTREIEKLRTPEAACDLLVEKVWEIGRILDVAQENGSWKIRFQPWEEVRARKLKKSIKTPIPHYEITVSEDLQEVSCNPLEDKTCP